MSFFTKAVPVWLKGLEEQMNITAGFYTLLNIKGGVATLKVATSGFYRVFVNGEFVTYGPARCAHDYYRVDELSLALKVGENHIAVEVVNYYINSFASLRQAGFIQMEVEADNNILAATGYDEFRSFLLTDRVRKMERYSYQRPMAESYNILKDSYGWRVGLSSKTATHYPTAETAQKNLVKRGIAPFVFPISKPQKKLSEGRFIWGVKPQNPDDMRRAFPAGDPLKSAPGGFSLDEMEYCLLHELQEWQITQNTTINTEYKNQTVLAEGEFEILSLPIEKTGFIAADITCTKDGCLYFVVDETLSVSGDIDPKHINGTTAIRLDMQVGEYPFQSIESFGFKYIKVACTKGAFEIKNLRVVELACSEPITVEYKGNAPVLLKVFNAAVETFKQNAVDIFMDCPTRERAGWLCDSFFTARTEHYLTGDNAIERNFLENYRLPENFEFLPKGMVPMCYPADVLKYEFIPNWAMWFVVELEDYVLRTGDKDFIPPFKKRVYDLLNYFEKFENSDGLLEKLKNWVFVEWSEANNFVQDINFPSNMMYARMLRSVGFLFDDFEATEKAERLEEVIRNRSFDGQFFTDNEVYKDGIPVSTGQRTETCQYYAFFTGVATPEKYPELWNRMLTEFGPDRKEKGLWPEIWPSNAFIGNFLRLELLLKDGKYQQLLDECAGYFEYMADRTGTLWENITDHASCNHGFASYAAVFILEAEKHLSK